MTMNDDQRHAAAAALYRAERTREWIEPVTATWPDATIEDAYAIGQLVTDMKVADGRTIMGHKIGYTSAAMREAFGAMEPDYGTLFDDWFLDDGASVSMATLNRPWIEIEIAFVLRRRLAGPAISTADVLAATDFIAPAIELVDSRFTYDSPEGAVIDSIADAASCGFVMVGGCRVALNEVDPSRVTGTLSIDGVAVACGTGAAVMDNPVNAVAWLARKLADFGVAMEPGHTVLSGSFIAARPVAAGNTVTADFGTLGQIQVSFTD